MSRSISFLVGARRQRAHGLFVVAALTAAACGPGAAGEAVRPATPSAARAIEAEAGEGAAVVCRPNSYAEPLVVDLSAAARVDFEAAMDSGVALVNYDCKAVRLLKDCRLAGDYRFAGVSRKEEVIHLDNRDEIRANLPLGQGKLGGEMERASALDIAFVLVGKRTTPALVSRGVLEGSQCGEATHFVKAATVGAFAIQTSTKGRVAAAAEVFTVSAGGESSSAKQTAKKDGNPQACEQSKPGSDAPPAECRSAIRFELVPVSDKAPESKGKGDGKGDGKGEGKGGGKEAKSLQDPCPEGFQLAAGKCAKASEAKQAHLCAPKDVADCEAQCSAGHAGSCYNLGNLAFVNYNKDVPDAQNVIDEKRALDLWKKACDGGVPRGCSDYGYMRAKKIGGFEPDYKEAIAYNTRACDGGDADGCLNLAEAHFNGRWGLEKDGATGVIVQRRACKLGDSGACRELAEFYFAGKHVARDPVAADKMLGQFCAQGDQRACYDIGLHLLGLYDDDEAPEKPVAEIPDAKARGRAILAKSCSEKGGAGSCTLLGRILADDNDPKGRALLAKQCPDEGQAHRPACGYLGKAMFDGKGGPADKARGAELMIKSQEDALVLLAAQAFDKGDGVKKDPARAKKMIEKLCTKEDYEPACAAMKGDSAKPATKGAAAAPRAKK